MKPNLFIQQLSQSIPRIVVCAGEEAFFQEEVLAAVIEAVRRESPQSPVHNFEMGQGEADAAAGQRLLRDLQTPVLFGGMTLFAVRNGDKILKEIAKRLAERMENDPSLPNRLVLFARRVDGRTRFAKKLRAANGLVECKKLYSTPALWQRGAGEETELSRWVIEHAGALGLALSPEAAAFLITLCGNDLFLLHSELTKLRLVLPESKERTAVGVQEIENSTGMSAVHNPFDLWEKIESGGASEALKTLQVIMHNGLRSTGGRLETDAAAIAAILMSIFRDRVRMASQVALFQWQKQSDQEMMERLRISSTFYLQKLKASAGRLTAESVKTMNGALLDAERRIKRYGQPAVPIMETLVIRLSGAGK